MNYIGSKYSLMDFLTETIANIAGTETNKDSIYRVQILVRSNILKKY